MLRTSIPRTIYSFLTHSNLQRSSFGHTPRAFINSPISQISQRSFNSNPLNQTTQSKKLELKKWTIIGGLTALGTTGALLYSQYRKTNPYDSIIRIGDFQVLPNGILLPGHFDVSKINEYENKYEICDTLKKEISKIFENSNFNEMKEFINNRGSEFLIPMTDLNPWTSNLNSIYETALVESKRRWSEEELLFIFNYYIENSEEAKVTKINLLHMLVRTELNPRSLKNTLIKKTLEINPELLKERLVLDKGLDMTPAEMAIRTSYNESLMFYLLDESKKLLKDFSNEEKEKLLFHARWLLKGGVQDTVSMGERLIEHIQNLPTR